MSKHCNFLLWLEIDRDPFRSTSTKRKQQLKHTIFSARETARTERKHMLQCIATHWQLLWNSVSLCDQLLSCISLAVAGLRVSLSRFLEGALYKYSEWMNEYCYRSLQTRLHYIICTRPKCTTPVNNETTKHWTVCHSPIATISTIPISRHKWLLGWTVPRHRRVLLRVVVVAHRIEVSCWWWTVLLWSIALL